MENKEMKKTIPVELNEEELNMVAGGENVISSLPAVFVDFNNVVIGTAVEGEYCLRCGTAFEKGETIYRCGNPINGYCERCSRISADG